MDTASHLQADSPALAAASMAVHPVQSVQASVLSARSLPQPVDASLTNHLAGVMMQVGCGWVGGGNGRSGCPHHIRVVMPIRNHGQLCLERRVCLIDIRFFVAGMAWGGCVDVRFCVRRAGTVSQLALCCSLAAP